VVDVGFPEAVLILGVILALTAFLSGWFHGTVLSISVFSVLAGLVLASAGILEVNPGAAIVVFIVQIALLLTLFTDGSTPSESCFARSGMPPPERS
jgi:hypothetical protein